MSPHSDTLFWFWANQSLLFLLNAAINKNPKNTKYNTTCIYNDLGQGWGHYNDLGQGWGHYNNLGQGWGHYNDLGQGWGHYNDLGCITTYIFVIK